MTHFFRNNKVKSIKINIDKSQMNKLNEKNKLKISQDKILRQNTINKIILVEIRT